MKILLFNDGTYAVPNYAKFPGDEAGAIALAEKGHTGRVYRIADEAEIPPDPPQPTAEDKFQSWMRESNVASLVEGMARTVEAKKARGEPPDILPPDLAEVWDRALAAFKRRIAL